MKTVLITGCSTGFGLDTARTFLDRGWRVVATMRTPREDVLPASEHLRVLRLDVTDAQSIRDAVDQAGPIDVLVNNAGVAMMNPLEVSSTELIRDLFETNVIGLMAVTRAVLPQFRERKAGVVVNLSSSLTLRAMPLFTVYTASKAAVTAFTEVLAVEMAPLGVRARVVIPGYAPATDLGANMMTRSVKDIPEDYAGLFHRGSSDDGPPSGVTQPSDVTDAVWQAATDPSSPLIIPAGADAIAWAQHK